MTSKELAESPNTATCRVIPMLLAVICATAAGQATFERFYGQNGWSDFFTSACRTADNGFVAAGATESFGAVSIDLWVVRTDSLGNVMWMSLVGGEDDQYAYDVEPVWDGGFVAAGVNYFSGGTAGGIMLVRYTPSGDTLWTRTFGGPAQAELAMSVTTSPDSCFIVAARARSEGYDLIKVDAAGNKLWGRSYQGINGSAFNSVETTRDGYVLCGITWDAVNNECDYIVRTDWTGDTMWTRALPLRVHNCGHRARQTADDGFIVSGASSDTEQPYHAALIRLTAVGDTQWTRVFPESYLWYDDYGTDVLEESDGGFLLLTRGGDSDSIWPLLIKVDANGGTRWERRMGTQSRAYCTSLIRAGEELLATGAAELPDSAYDEGYLLKIDGLGRLAVADRPASAMPLRVQPMPNPFRDRVVFSLPAGTRDVRLEIADATGRIVHRATGKNAVWNGRDRRGAELPAGVYLYRISGDGCESRGRVVKASSRDDGQTK